MAGLFAQYLPNPTVLVFEVYLGLLAIALLSLALVPETVTRKQRLTLRLEGLGLPPQGRGEFVAAGMAAFSAFALTGLFTSLAPGFVPMPASLPAVLTGHITRPASPRTT